MSEVSIARREELFQVTMQLHWMSVSLPTHSQTKLRYAYEGDHIAVYTVSRIFSADGEYLHRLVVQMPLRDGDDIYKLLEKIQTSISDAFWRAFKSGYESFKRFDDENLEVKEVELDVLYGLS